MQTQESCQQAQFTRLGVFSHRGRRFPDWRIFSFWFPCLA